MTDQPPDAEPAPTPGPAPRPTSAPAPDAMTDPQPGPEAHAGPAHRTDRGPEPEPGRERLRHALVRPSKRQVVVAVLLAVLGFAFVVQVRDTKANDTYAGLRESELI